jgi:hypothetical protein
VLLLCQGGARFQCVEDDADEESFEAADRFTAALAFALFAFEVGARCGVVARLCDCDPVEGCVELAVAAAVESVALDPARACFERCNAAVRGRGERPAASSRAHARTRYECACPLTASTSATFEAAGTRSRAYEARSA